MEQTVNPTDADLQRMYSQNKEQFRTPERVKLRVIMLKTVGKTPADAAKIQAQADDILKQIKAGYPSLLATIPRILDRRVLERLNAIGLYEDVYVNNQHDLSPSNG